MNFFQFVYLCLFSTTIVSALWCKKSLPPKCYHKNEVYACGSACQTTCATLGQDCPIINVRCNYGCYCKEGYARNDRGECVPISECPDLTDLKCNRPNEVYACGSACQTTCATLGQDCPTINKRCNYDCYCKEEYARNDQGECVPISECPDITVPTCIAETEVFKCGSGCDRICNTLRRCGIVNNGCISKCYCNDGYARNNNGVCVLIENC